MTDTLRERQDAPPSPAGRRVDWRLVTSSALLAGLAAAFWLTSRYPALSDKARIAGDVEIAGRVGFDTLVTIDRDDSLLWQVAGNAVNWLWVNRQGMAFGIAFGAVMLTVLSLVKRRSFRSATANSALGVVIGAPLGVCVNCAAPISHAMRRGGARAETALAAMFSSPTYNVVVISIAMSLLPGYMVVIKLGLSLAFILLIVPRLARVVPEAMPLSHHSRLTQRLLGDPLGTNFDIGVPAEEGPPDPDRGPGRAVAWVAAATMRNLWEVARLAVPLMLLAAVVGSFIVTVLPFDRVIDHLPSDGMLLIVAALLVVSAVGLVLPMPIAFDVVVAGSLWAAGLPPRYVMALFFTLGIYSVYSAFVVGVVFSRRVAWMLAVPLLALGVVAGFAAQSWESWRDSREQAAVERMLDNLSPSSAAFVPAMAPAGEVLDSLAGDRIVFEAADVEVSGDVAVTVERAPFVPGSGSVGAFARIPGTEIGLDDRPRANPAYEFIIPFSQLGGIGSGDVHGDGWDDVVVTSDVGVVLYANRSGTFVAQEVANGALLGGVATLAAIVDVDGDGQLDIVATFLDGRNVVAFNSGGRFDPDDVVDLPRHSDRSAFVAALGGGDLDRDGDVDFVAGWWSQVQGTAVNHVWRQNAAGGFDVEELAGHPGQTLSVLVSDITGDGWPDVMVGNDFAEPDVLYRNDGQGALIEVPASDGLIPNSTDTTMSLVATDLDNDLAVDLFAGQISGQRQDDSSVDSTDHRTACRDAGVGVVEARCLETARLGEAVDTAQRERSLAACTQFDDRRRDACASIALGRSRSFDDATVCEPLKTGYPEIWALCDSHSIGAERISDDGGTRPADYEAQPSDLESVVGRNAVLHSGESGFTDETTTWGLGVAGWVWDASFFDVDNDGDVDVTMTTGWRQQRVAQSNVMFRNDGERFVNETEQAGFVDHLPTLGSTVVDVDNDGDLDLVTVPSDGPPVLFRNGMSAGAAVSISLDGPVGTTAVGARVVLETTRGVTMMRSIGLGGGYSGFDAPTVHFGVGDHTIGDVHITWTDGTSTTLRGLEPGHRYLVRAG